VEEEGSSGSGVERSRVRRQRLLEIGGRVGRAEREIVGVGSGVPRGRGRKREREGADMGLTAGPRGQNGSGRCGRRRQRALMAEVGWRTREGGGARRG
jgi:hypothetical protein